MIIRTLRIQNLRNHAFSSVEFCDGINVLHGPNGAGKTTILEALTLCAFTKTFLPSSDDELTQHSAQGFAIGCEAETDHGSSYKISISAPRNEKRSISSGMGNNLSPKDVVGQIPMVVLSPDFKSITFGSPQDRRAFMDRLLAQCSSRYYDELTNLRRILKQRNLLLSARGGYFDRMQFSVWTEQLIQCATEISVRRRDFVKGFVPFFMDAYHTLSPDDEVVGVSYIADAANGAALDDQLSPNDITRLIRARAEALEEEECRRMLSLWGPQKDDLEIRINGGRARESASQGQHKSLLVCLKKAEFEYLREQREETPILLLDDVFSELDEARTSRIFATVLREARQSFITTTEAERLRSIAALPKHTRFFRLYKGQIDHVEDHFGN